MYKYVCMRARVRMYGYRSLGFLTIFNPRTRCNLNLYVGKTVMRGGAVELGLNSSAFNDKRLLQRRLLLVAYVCLFLSRLSIIEMATRGPRYWRG